MVDSSRVLGDRRFQAIEIGQMEWDEYWPRVRQSNLLQSWQYGEAKTKGNKWHPVRFLIYDEFGAPIALAQLLVSTWPIVGGLARLNRGPLLIDGEPSSLVGRDTTLCALDALLTEGRRRRWRLLFVAPELEADAENAGRLRQLGLRPRVGTPWGSTRLALAPSEDELLAGLNGKWRNLLRKAQKTNLLLQRHEGGGAGLETVVSAYKRAQSERGFRGVSDDLLQDLALQTGTFWYAWQYSVCPAGDVGSHKDILGMLVSIVHGDTATYFVSYTNSHGRKANANYLMLWQAILDAKRAGCEWFDLGGLNINTPHGVAHFKRGINGQVYSLVGEWRSKVF